MNTHTTPICITDYKGELHGKRVILRAGLNVPIANGLVDDDFRIQRFLPTLSYLEEQGAIVIVLAHLGRELDDTLEPVAEYIADHVHNMMFYKDFFHSYGTDSFTSNIQTLQSDLEKAEPGNIFLLDNVRQTKSEKSNDQELAQSLADLGDIYVHDAFPAAHRKHMSTFGIPSLFNKESKFSGVTFHMEQTILQKAMKPESPSVFVLGGAKFDTKLPLIESFLPIYDKVMIGGALANNLIKLAGYEVGTSLVEDLTIGQENSLKKVLESSNFILPSSVTCETESGEKVTKTLSEITNTDNILDVSPETVLANKELFTDAKSFLWNGPLGYYEGGYVAGSQKLAELVGSSESNSIAGGGDTIAAIYSTKQEDNFTFLSSAGGAMITYLSEGTLPGIDVLIS